RFDASLYTFAGDRFIVRDWPEQQTLAGGTILDPDATRRGFRTEPTRSFLQTRADRPDDAAAFVATALARDGIVPRGSLLRKSRFSGAEVDRAVDQLIEDKTLLIRGDCAVDAAHWQTLTHSAIEFIDAAHQAHPEQIGLRVADLRQKLAKTMGGTAAFDALVEELCRSGFAKSGVYLRRTTHRPALPPHLQPAGAKLRRLLSIKPLEPPSRKELTPDSVSQQALRFLVQTGEAVEIGEELVLHVQAYNTAVETIRGYITSRGGASVSELRQVLNTSRRVMVPLLEKLDREGITLRQGDKRVLKQPR
ncbi:MAG TPA: SelB C-terminal domain-containing protein, partial [Tepidisphaeraceae bacterium]|nr:SelB C-terminal domain-containing protein [Tepidisphaeraceae bacterium]